MGPWARRVNEPEASHHTPGCVCRACHWRLSVRSERGLCSAFLPQGWVLPSSAAQTALSPQRAYLWALVNGAAVLLWFMVFGLK